MSSTLMMVLMGFGICVTVAIFTVSVLMFKKFAKSQQKVEIVETKKDEPPPFVKVEAKGANVLLFQSLEEGGIIFAKMREEKIPVGSQQYMADWVGKWLYFLENHGGEFKRYEPQDIVVQLPSDLYEAIYMPANRKLWSFSRNPLEKIAMWAPVVVCGMGMILLFAMAN